MMGWMGVYSEVKHTLRMYGAEFDEKGEPKFVSESPAFFLGIHSDNNDVVVSDNCQCLIKGQPVGVAYLMNSTSYGVRNVRVI
jgi:hypothetical protein